MPWQPAYATTAQLKSYVRIDGLDTQDDAELDFAVEAASRAIDQATNRQFGQVTPVEERFYTSQFDTRRRRWIVEIDDVMDTTGMLVDFDSAGDETFSESFAFRPHPFNNDTRARPFERVILGPGASANRCEGAIRVTALWGWDAVPTTIVQATLLQASRFLARRNAPFGVAGSPEMGTELRLQAKADPDVKVMLRNYTRNWGAV